MNYLLLKKTLYPRERLRRKTKYQNQKQESIIDQGKAVNFEPDLKEIPNINIDVPIVRNRSEDKIMNYIIKDLLADNEKCYIEHEEGSDTFTLTSRIKTIFIKQF